MEAPGTMIEVELSDPIVVDDEGALPARAGSAVSRTPLFGDFSRSELLAVIQGLKLQSRGAGEVVMIEGEPGATLYVLTEGIVRVYVRGVSGGSVQIRELKAPAFFGEISIVRARRARGVTHPVKRGANLEPRGSG